MTYPIPLSQQRAQPPIWLTEDPTKAAELRSACYNVEHAPEGFLHITESALRRFGESRVLLIQEADSAAEARCRSLLERLKLIGVAVEIYDARKHTASDCGLRHPLPHWAEQSLISSSARDVDWFDTWPEWAKTKWHTPLAKSSCRTLLGDHIPTEEVTMLAGQNAAMRTRMALVIAAHVACGRALGGHSCLHRPVVFVGLDTGEDQALRELALISRNFDLPIDILLSNIHIESGLHGRLAESIRCRRIEDDREPLSILEPIKGKFAGAGLVVIDNSNLLLDAPDHNHAAIASILYSLNQLARAGCFAALLTARAGREATRSESISFESTPWTDMARQTLVVQVNKGRVSLLDEHQVSAKRAQIVHFSSNESGNITPSTGECDDVQSTLDDESVLDALWGALDARLHVPCSFIGSGTAWHILRLIKELNPELREDDGKMRVHSSLIRLKRSKLIQTAVTDNDNGNKTPGLVPNPEYEIPF